MTAQTLIRDSRLIIIGIAVGWLILWVVVAGALEPRRGVVCVRMVEPDYNIVTHPYDGFGEPSVYYISSVGVDDDVYSLRVVLPYGVVGTPYANEFRFNLKERSASMCYEYHEIGSNAVVLKSDQVSARKGDDGTVVMSALFAMDAPLKSSESAAGRRTYFTVTASVDLPFISVSRVWSFYHRVCKALLSIVLPRDARLSL